jgi:hypothetical protein
MTQTAPKTWIDWLAAFAPVIVSSVAIIISIWVATRQNDLQARQLRKELFDRRFAVYTEVREFLMVVFQVNGHDAIHSPAYQRFLEAAEKAEMLFGAEVIAYLKDISTTVGKAYVYAAEEERIVAAGAVKRIQEGSDIMIRLYDLLNRRNEVFRPYMSLGTSR